MQQVSVDDIEALRNLGDQMRDKVGGVVVLASVFAEGKISIRLWLRKMLSLKVSMPATLSKRLPGSAAAAAADVLIWHRQAVKMLLN